MAIPQVPIPPIPAVPPLPIPCLGLPPLPIPTLPTPFTIGLPLPIPSFNAALCCKILPFTIPPIPPLPTGTINPAIITVINEALGAITAYFDQFQFSCPLE
jgi:hypothetical protein